MSSGEKAFHDSVMHQLTRQLLEAQHQNVRLQAENREMKEQLKEATAATVPSTSAPSTAIATISLTDVSPSPADGDKDDVDADVDAVITRMHELLDDQVRRLSVLLIISTFLLPDALVFLKPLSMDFGFAWLNTV